MFAFRFQREVYDHDAVFLHNADQKNDSDYGYHAQVLAEQHEGEQSADTS
jgi:hypothetical protein